MPPPNTKAHTDIKYAEHVPRMIKTSIFADPPRIDATADLKNAGPSIESTTVADMAEKMVVAGRLAPKIVA